MWTEREIHKSRDLGNLSEEVVCLEWAGAANEEITCPRMSASKKSGEMCGKVESD